VKIKGERPHLVVVLDSIGGARLQSVTSRRHDLSSTLDSSNKRSSLAEPGAWHGKRIDLFFPASCGLGFCPPEKKANSKPKGQKRTPMSLPRSIPGSAMLRKVLHQASAEAK
jgi:hypothetical protein